MSCSFSVQAFCSGDIDRGDFASAFGWFIRVVVLDVSHLPVTGRVSVLLAGGGLANVVWFQVQVAGAGVEGVRFDVDTAHLFCFGVQVSGGDPARLPHFVVGRVNGDSRHVGYLFRPFLITYRRVDVVDDVHAPSTPTVK